MLTRAVFDSWDASGRGELTVAEMEAGIQAMLADDVERQPSGSAIIAVAKKIVRELSAEDGATVTVAELEELAAVEVAEIASSVTRQNPADLLDQEARSFRRPER